MFSLTPSERKVLLFIAILILCGAGLKFFNNTMRRGGTLPCRQAGMFSPQESVPLAVGTSRVNINTASQEELEKLPGIGPEIARRIIAFRSQIKKFENLKDLDQVEGVGEKKIELIKGDISF